MGLEALQAMQHMTSWLGHQQIKQAHRLAMTSKMAAKKLSALTTTDEFVQASGDDQKAGVKHEVSELAADGRAAQKQITVLAQPTKARLVSAGVAKSEIKAEEQLRGMDQKDATDLTMSLAAESHLMRAEDHSATLVEDEVGSAKKAVSRLQNSAWVSAASLASAAHAAQKSAKVLKMQIDKDKVSLPQLKDQKVRFFKY